MIDYRSITETQVARAVNRGMSDLMRGETLYVWYLPMSLSAATADERQVIRLSQDAPTEAWRLVTPERVPRNRDSCGIKAWANQFMGRLPILAPFYG